MPHRVLSVGQCGADHSAIAATLQRHFAATVIPAATARDAEKLLDAESFSLILVNRILDEDGGRGLDVIRQLRARSIPIMLVSNHDEAQAQAEAAGAAPGFGKAELGQSDMLERVRPWLG